jgi:hypothetical protein
LAPLHLKQLILHSREEQGRSKERLDFLLKNDATPKNQRVARIEYERAIKASERRLADAMIARVLRDRKLEVDAALSSYDPLQIINLLKGLNRFGYEQGTSSSAIRARVDELLAFLYSEITKKAAYVPY